MKEITIREIDNYPTETVRKNVIKEMNDKGFISVGFDKIKDESIWKWDFIVKKIRLKFRKG